MKQKIHSLYILKAWAAFMVVVLHTTMLGKDLLDPFLKTAVPTFLIISGYFLYDPNEAIMRKNVTRSFKKILKLIIIGNVIYTLFYAITKSKDLDFTNVTFWIYQLFVGHMIAGHFWYLTAFMWTLVILYVLLCIDKAQILYLLSIVSFFVYTILVWKGAAKGVHYAMYVHGNALSYGLPCIALGMFARRKETIINKEWHGKRAVIISLIVVFLAAIEYAFLRLYLVDTNCIHIQLFTLPMALLPFLYSIANPEYGKGSICAKIGERHSQFIYMYHGIAIFLVSIIPCVAEWRNANSLVVFLLTLVMSVLYITFVSTLKKIKA